MDLRRFGEIFKPCPEMGWQHKRQVHQLCASALRMTAIQVASSRPIPARGLLNMTNRVIFRVLPCPGVMALPGWRKADFLDDGAIALVFVEEVESGIGLDPEQEGIALVERLLEQGEGFVVLAEHGLEPGDSHR
jgi:hypothetical protein